MTQDKCIFVVMVWVLVHGWFITPANVSAANGEAINLLDPALLPQVARPDFNVSHSVMFSTSLEKRMTAFPSNNMAISHKYLGYGTIVLALGAAFSSSNEDVHEPIGYAAATAATLTCITGFMEYSDYFDFDEGFSKYNVHIASGVAATAGFIITAILGSDDKSHGGIGGGSTVLMCVPIVVLKW